MIPAQPSSTATAVRTLVHDPARQACDQNSPRNGSCSPPTIAGWPVGATSSIPPVHQSSDVRTEDGRPDVEPRVVVEQVAIGRLRDELDDLRPVRRQHRHPDPVVLEHDGREPAIGPRIGDPGARAEGRPAHRSASPAACRGRRDRRVDVGVAVGRRDVPQPARRGVDPARQERLDEPAVRRRVALSDRGSCGRPAGSSTAVWTIGPTWRTVSRGDAAARPPPAARRAGRAPDRLVPRRSTRWRSVATPAAIAIGLPLNVPLWARRPSAIGAIDRARPGHRAQRDPAGDRLGEHREVGRRTPVAPAHPRARRGTR